MSLSMHTKVEQHCQRNYKVDSFNGRICLLPIFIFFTQYQNIVLLTVALLTVAMLIIYVISTFLLSSFRAAVFSQLQSQQL